MKSPIFAMVAGELSGDTLGADLIIELQHRFPDARFIGIGGPKMQALGFESLFEMERLSVMGFFEVLKRLPELLKIRKKLIQILSEASPAVFIGIDAPDFNFTVEKELKQRGIKTVHYVGPSVWAWREKRLLKIKEYVDGILTLFPFEAPIYKRYSIPQAFVGHPLAKQKIIDFDRDGFCKKLGLSNLKTITAVLPGSRISELETMLPLYLQSIALLSAKFPEMQFIIPAANQRIYDFIYEKSTLYPELKIHIILGESSKVLLCADQAIITSGTATLEAALMGCPMVIAIKVHPVSFWIMKKLATTEFVGLPNILAGRKVVTELIQEQATVENIVSELSRLVTDQELRSNLETVFIEQYDQLNQESSRLAADAITKWAHL
jgi:lipid-A-disaccharide synthase